MNGNDFEILNKKYEQDFHDALNVYENEYGHGKLIEFLKDGSVAQKQAACIALNCIYSKDDANVLMNNLTGCDGKIREAVSFRLPEFVSKNPEYFIGFEDIFIEAITDINGNICRNTISAISNLVRFDEFTKKFCDELTKRTLVLALKAKDFDIQEGKYKINKEIFKLYWYLETIYVFADNIETRVLKDILNNTKLVNDYTIREKTAKILSKLQDDFFDDIREELKRDSNYYVKRLVISE